MQKNKNIIYDIGFHKGQDTNHYLKKGYNVIAIEANPDLVKYGEHRFKSAIKEGRLAILNIGIAPKKGVIPFYKNLKNSQWSSFDKAIGTRDDTPFETIEVPTKSTAELFEEYGVPYYLKIDIEGYDKYCIQDLPNDKDLLPDYTSCEATEIELLNTLYEKGYRRFKMIHQGDGFKQINIKREKTLWFPRFVFMRNGLNKHYGKYLPFNFEYGSTGPFGEDTDGNWNDYETVKQAYTTWISKDNTLNKVSWFDFHAAI